MHITVASYLDPLEARIVQGRLLAEGIEAHLADEQQIINDWHWRLALGGVKLRVHPDHVTSAREVLQAIGAGEYIEEGETQTAAEPDSWSSRLAYFGLFALGLPLPWTRQRISGSDQND